MIEFFSGLIAVFMWLPFGLVGFGQEIYSNFLKQPIVNIKEPGIVFSFKQVERLGLDPRIFFLKTLDDFKPRYLRVIAYWDRVEKKDNEFDFSELDFQMQESSKRGIKTTLAVGEKVPRWPECHYPDWVKAVDSESERQKQVLDYLRAVILRYKNYENLEFWQLENEPFLAFGECPDFDSEFFKRKLDFLKSLDDRPVVITSSGELDTWLRAFVHGDRIGFSVYRRFFLSLPDSFWQTKIGKIGLDYPLPARFYKTKYDFFRFLFGKEAMVTEFQLEPWLDESPTKVDLDRQFREFGLDSLKEYLDYAKRLGFSRVYFWGVEWWYWLDQKNHPEFLDYVKTNVFNDQSVSQ
ncbi:MAG: hypothetical protein A2391_02840 [Candidatus Brennerbacteria bacterium RIFOXYB1_FULL_41_13]|nr:MAG: hypothetical protein UU61_C0038G0002 [Parcubacteria group bacterium GW2011_GWB1_41_4]OGY39386.1 MAG: hypothetical protein A2391_02840 [Candidatus Brennerbacteria bacterium RIFOXYB1_FULL_41_13]